MLLNEWITEEIKEEFKEYLETNDNERALLGPPDCFSVYPFCRL